jgi:hypothetical protein
MAIGLQCARLLPNESDDGIGTVGSRQRRSEPLCRADDARLPTLPCEPAAA